MRPLSWSAYNNLAYLFATANESDLEEALTLAAKAKELVPDNAAVSDTLGWIYYLSGMHDEAISVLEVAVNGMPWEPSIRFHLGMAYYKKNQHRLALAEMEQALKISSSFKEAEEARSIIRELSN